MLKRTLRGRCEARISDFFTKEKFGPILAKLKLPCQNKFWQKATFFLISTKFLVVPYILLCKMYGIAS